MTDDITIALETVREWVQFGLDVAKAADENRGSDEEHPDALAALSTIEAELTRLREDLDAITDEWGSVATPYEKDYLRLRLERDEAVAALREEKEDVKSLLAFLRETRQAMMAGAPGYQMARIVENVMRKFTPDAFDEFDAETYRLSTEGDSHDR